MKKQITEIKITLGELQQIDATIFESLLKDLMSAHRDRFAKAAIHIESEKATLKCRNCENEWPFGAATADLSDEEAEAIHVIPELAHAYITCPRCHSVDFDVAKGRGVGVDSITGVK